MAGCARSQDLSVLSRVSIVSIVSKGYTKGERVKVDGEETDMLCVAQEQAKETIESGEIDL